MTSLLFAAVLSLRPVGEVPMAAQTDTPLVSYSRDEEFEYLGTPDGLYRSPNIATTPLERIAFAGESINAVAFDGEALYISRGLSHFALWPEHTLLRSVDHGVTFEAVGEGLRSCIDPTECGYLIPRQITFAPERLFVNAGGNVLVSADDGATYRVLIGVTVEGKPAPQLCPITYERLGERMLLGGECPLDVGYLSAGTLDLDLLDWSEEPVRLTEPPMENRNVQFIRDLGDNIVFAGIEGALLKSTDGGSTFRYVLHYDISDTETYPYIGQLASSNGLLIAGGFDKADQRGWLASSSDDGETWSDISFLVADSEIVSLLARDVEGRLLVVTYGDGRLRLSELVTTSVVPTKRRSARH
ncbi:MAG TPA: hypothetical protein VKB93_02885 [Thermoanaerobaculia bacterium]|nr:hypothetical protein [Thermoanaerobaculia bacterium]